MKTLIGVILFVVVSVCSAGNLAKMTVEEKCDAWASFGIYGAVQFVRGAPREIEFVGIRTIEEMFEHQQDTKKKLYVIADKDNTPEEFAFLAGSTLAGYDKRKAWDETHTSPPRFEDFHQDMIYECLEKTR